MRKVPLLPVAAFVMLGIAVQHWLPGVGVEVYAALVAAIGVAIGVGWLLKRVGRAIVPLVVLLFVSIGAMRGAMDEFQRRSDHWSRYDGQWVTCVLHIEETPQPRARSYKTRATVESVNGNVSCGNVKVYIGRDTAACKVCYGDRLQARLKVDASRQSLYVGKKQYEIISHDGTTIRALCERTRIALLERMYAGPLTERHAGVVAALVLGWRADVDGTTMATFRDVGLAHLLCVSGLHVGMLAAIVGMLLWPLGRMRKGRAVRGAVQIVTVWVFAFISGAAPSAVRAALMFTLFIVSDIFDRRTPKLNLLAATALLTLIVQPMLLFDVGWQMSYAAVAGILLVSPLLAIVRSKILGTAVVSISATVATSPIVLQTFGRFQLYFIVANAIVVPLSGLLLALSVAYTMVPCVVLAWPLAFILDIINWLTSFVASWPGAVVSDITLSVWSMALLVASVLMMIFGARCVGEKVEQLEFEEVQMPDNKGV